MFHVKLDVFPTKQQTRNTVKTLLIFDEIRNKTLVLN